MSSSNSVLSGESFPNSPSTNMLSLNFEDFGRTEARLWQSTTPTPVARKRHVPEKLISIHSELSNPSGTVGMFQSQSLSETLVNVTQQLQKDSLGLLVSDETSIESTAGFRPNAGGDFQLSEQAPGLETDIPSSHFPLRASPSSIASDDILCEDGDKENSQLLDGELQPQSDQESLEGQQDPDDYFVPDPFITFQVIAEEFHINSNITDPHGDIRRLELVTEIHQRLMKTLSDQSKEKSDISPQHLPATNVVDLTREEPVVEERSEQCSFCQLAGFDSSSDEDVVLLDSEMVDICDECRDCQTFREEHQWLMEASQAYYERYGGGAEAPRGYP